MALIQFLVTPRAKQLCAPAWGSQPPSTMLPGVQGHLRRPCSQPPAEGALATLLCLLTSSSWVPAVPPSWKGYRTRCLAPSRANGNSAHGPALQHTRG